MLMCAMVFGVASTTSCKKTDVPPAGSDAETPVDPGTGGGGNGGGELTPSDKDYLTVKYTGDEDMDGLNVSIGKWSETSNEGNYTEMANGGAMFNGSNEAPCFPELLNSLQAGDKIWICIPKVVKYFHTLTAAELSAKVLNLPDKDGGNTMIEGELLGGKPYKNDWVVALYMNVDDPINSRPLYWATGNLIAVKTGTEGEPSDPAFYLATLEENAAEAKGGAEGNPYNNNLPNDDTDKESYSKQDGYIDCPEGYRWDCFLAGDGKGVRTDGFKDDGNGYLSDAMAGLKDPNFGGVVGLDVVTTNLGGCWSTPSNWDTAHDKATNGTSTKKFTPNPSAGNLSGLFFKGDSRTSKKTITTSGEMYWEVSVVTAGGTNTLLIPAAGMRRYDTKKDPTGQQSQLYSNGKRVLLMAANSPVNAANNFMTFDSYADPGYDEGYFMNNLWINMLVPIRPVTY